MEHEIEARSPMNLFATAQLDMPMDALLPVATVREFCITLKTIRNVNPAN